MNYPNVRCVCEALCTRSTLPDCISAYRSPVADHDGDSEIRWLGAAREMGKIDY